MDAFDNSTTLSLEDAAKHTIARLTEQTGKNWEDNTLTESNIAHGNRLNRVAAKGYPSGRDLQKQRTKVYDLDISGLSSDEQRQLSNALRELCIPFDQNRYRARLKKPEDIKIINEIISEVKISKTQPSAPISERSLD